ncbi:dynamin family protein, partial [Romboutsia sp.]|uniref:dynamin family protein n=1 Tax=Romboutsia sp. TaxID=1965302 RepID=UPI003F301AA9
LYSKRRENVLGEISKIRQSASFLNNRVISDICNTYEKELLEDKFNIVVVGEFSRGKSMFINALLGKKILPSSTKPTTAILNRISYSKEEVFKIKYRDSTSENISEESFKKIVAPKEPLEGDTESEENYEEAIKKLQSIEFADIGYPINICKNGIEIIDTPGTNDLDSAREEITYKFIPKSDVAIMLLSAQQILTESEMNFLKDRIFKNDIKKVFFVINFKDRIKDKQDQEKIIQYAKEHLKDVVKAPKIFMVSAKSALNYKRSKNNEVVKGEVVPIESTGFFELESELSEYLSIESGRGKLLKYIEKVKRLTNELDNNGIKISLASLDMDSKEVEKKVNNLKREIIQVENRGKDTIKNMRVALLNSENELSNKLRKNLEKIAYEAELAVQNYTGELDSKGLAKYIESKVASIQTESQAEINKLQNNIINNHLSIANDRLGKDWNKFEKVMDKEFKISSSVELYGIQEADEDFTVAVSSLGYGAMCAGLLLFNVSAIISLPALLFGGKAIFKFFKNINRENVLNKAKEQITKRYRNGIPDTVNKFKKDWKNTVDKVVHNVEIELDRKVGILENQLDNIIKERNDEQLKINEKRNILLEERNKLNKINLNLYRFYNEINI